MTRFERLFPLLFAPALIWGCVVWIILFPLSQSEGHHVPAGWIISGPVSAFATALAAGVILIVRAQRSARRES